MGCGASTAAPQPLGAASAATAPTSAAADTAHGAGAGGTRAGPGGHDDGGDTDAGPGGRRARRPDLITSVSMVLEAYFKPLAADGSEYDSDSHLRIPLANYLAYAFPRAKVEFEFKRLKTHEFRVRVRSLNGRALNVSLIDEDAPANVVAYDRNFVFGVGHSLRALARRGAHWTPDIAPAALLRLFVESVRLCLLGGLDAPAVATAVTHAVHGDAAALASRKGVSGAGAGAGSGLASVKGSSSSSSSGLASGKGGLTSGKSGSGLSSTTGLASTGGTSSTSAGLASFSGTAAFASALSAGGSGAGGGGGGGGEDSPMIRDPTVKRRALKERQDRERQDKALEEATPRRRLLALLAAAGFAVEDKGDKFLSQLQRALETVQDAVLCYAFGPGAHPGPVTLRARYPVAAADAEDAARTKAALRDAAARDAAAAAKPGAGRARERDPAEAPWVRGKPVLPAGVSTAPGAGAATASATAAAAATATVGVMGKQRVLVTAATALPPALRGAVRYADGITHLPAAPIPGAPLPPPPAPAAGKQPAKPAAAAANAASAATASGPESDSAAAAAAAADGETPASEAEPEADTATATGDADSAASPSASAASTAEIAETPPWWFAVGSRSRPSATVSGRDLLGWYLSFLVCASGHLPVPTLPQALYGARAGDTVAAAALFRFLATGDRAALRPDAALADTGLCGDAPRRGPNASVDPVAAAAALRALRLPGAKLTALATTSALVADQSPEARAAIAAAAARAVAQSSGGAAGTSTRSGAGGGSVGAEGFRAFWAELLSHVDVGKWSPAALESALGLSPREGWRALLAHWSWVAYHHACWQHEALAAGDEDLHCTPEGAGNASLAAAAGGAGGPEADLAAVASEASLAALAEMLAFSSTRELRVAAEELFSHDRQRPYLHTRLLHLDTAPHNTDNGPLAAGAGAPASTPSAQSCGPVVARELRRDMFLCFFALNCRHRAENVLVVARDLLHLYDLPGHLATVAPTLHTPRTRRVAALFRRFATPPRTTLGVSLAVPSAVPNQVVPRATLIMETEKCVLGRKRAIVAHVHSVKLKPSGAIDTAGVSDEEASAEVKAARAAVEAVKLDKTDRSERGEILINADDFAKAMRRSGVLESGGRGVERFWYLMLAKYYC